MTWEPLSPLPCAALVARAVNAGDTTSSVPKRVRKSAFIPRKHGQDNDGLSVSLVRPGVLGFLRDRSASSSKEAVTLHVGRVREVSAEGHNLDVTSDPLDDDPHHALIVGFPPRHEAESPTEKAIWNRLAELLAVQARFYLGT
jgi:hypothetical protein